MGKYCKCRKKNVVFRMVLILCGKINIKLLIVVSVFGGRGSGVDIEKFIFLNCTF